MDPCQSPPTVKLPPRLAWLPLTLTLLAPPLVALAGVMAVGFFKSADAGTFLIIAFLITGLLCWLFLGV